MTLEEKLALIRQVGEEIITEEDLVTLLKSGDSLVAYDGFEPSGQMHIAQGIVRTININKMIRAGFRFKMWVADWHAWANNKMGGDLDKIQTVGKYFIEVWKACGMDMDNVEFVWASDAVKDDAYWKLVLQVARSNSIGRFVRTAQIMGREESMDLTAAQILYSCMQTADIFYLGARLTQLGMDQRKVNMLAREIGHQLGYWKPVVVSHHMLMGLQHVSADPEGDKREETIARKMSKSNPDSAIFMTDSEDEVIKKINKAYCPEGVVEDNPILEYCKYILFESMPQLDIERPDKFGGNLSIGSYKELEEMFVAKTLHPMDLKKSVSAGINTLLDPVRKHFVENAHARELLEEVRSYKVTR